jgi:hypothetical protein
VGATVGADKEEEATVGTEGGGEGWTWTCLTLAGVFPTEAARLDGSLRFTDGPDLTAVAMVATTALATPGSFLISASDASSSDFDLMTIIAP